MVSVDLYCVGTFPKLPHGCTVLHYKWQTVLVVLDAAATMGYIPTCVLQNLNYC